MVKVTNEDLEAETQKTIIQLQTQLDAEKKRSADLEAQLKKLEGSAEETEEARSDYERLQSDYDTLQSDYGAQTARIIVDTQAYEEDIIRLATRNKELLEVNAQQREEIAELHKVKHHYDIILPEHMLMKPDYHANKKALEVATKEIEILKQREERFNHALSLAKARRVNAESNLAKAQEELTLSRTSLVEVQQKYDELWCSFWRAAEAREYRNRKEGGSYHAGLPIGHPTMAFGINAQYVPIGAPSSKQPPPAPEVTNDTSNIRLPDISSGRMVTGDDLENKDRSDFFFKNTLRSLRQEHDDNAARFKDNAAFLPVFPVC